jgi:hypothetical protein
MMMLRSTASFLAMCITATAFGLVAPVAAQEPARSSGDWVVPRTPDGRPDLQGNWSSATITPLSRPRGQGPVLTPEEVERLEGTAAGYLERVSQPSDPDRVAPPVGGDGSVGAAGMVGGYNGIYIDRGDKVAVVYGEPRSSLITMPADGRMPSRTPESRERAQEARALRRQFGQYDHPEVRPVAERCLISFGSNAGPPMLPNGFYNNNYTIVQTPDHVLIMAEMVHDARIIKIGDGPRLPDHMRPWMGDSWGHWEGDVLVVETTNLHPLQQFSSAEMKVTERFSRMSEDALLYEFAIDDPSTYTEPWGGQVPMKALNGQVYEYACHEGNYALSNILSGARYQERMEAENQNQN